MAVAVETKQHIQQVALGLFMAQGYSSTSMDQIADTVGVTKPAVYYHFENKQTLFVELIEGLFVGVVTEYMGAVRAMPTLREVLRAVLESTAGIEEAFGAEGGGIDMGYISLMVDAARHFPDEVGSKLDDFYGEMRALLAERTTQAIEAGEIRADVDPQVLSTLVIGLVEGLILVGSLAPSCDYRGMERGLSDIVWNGIATGME